MSQEEKKEPLPVRILWFLGYVVLLILLAAAARWGER